MPKRKKRYLCRTIRTEADNVAVHVELTTRKGNVVRVEMCYLDFWMVRAVFNQIGRQLQEQN